MQKTKEETCKQAVPCACSMFCLRRVWSRPSLLSNFTRPDQTGAQFLCSDILEMPQIPHSRDSEIFGNVRKYSELQVLLGFGNIRTYSVIFVYEWAANPAWMNMEAPRRPPILAQRHGTLGAGSTLKLALQNRRNMTLPPPMWPPHLGRGPIRDAFAHRKGRLCGTPQSTGTPGCCMAQRGKPASGNNQL